MFRTYESIEDDETIEAIVIELEEMATEYSDKRREHLLEAKSDAEFFLRSGFGQLIEGFQKEFGDELDSTGNPLEVYFSASPLRVFDFV